MNISLGEISALVFKRSLRDDLDKVSMDGRMLNLLMEQDGKQSLGLVAQKTGLNLDTIRKVISKLLKLKLVEPVEKAVSMIEKEFLDYLNVQLAMAIGPIAQVLIEEAIADLGYTFSQFPKQRAAELVDLLARDIQHEYKRINFKRNMVNKIRGKS